MDTPPAPSASGSDPPSIRHAVGLRADPFVAAQTTLRLGRELQPPGAPATPRSAAAGSSRRRARGRRAPRSRRRPSQPPRTAQAPSTTLAARPWSRSGSPAHPVRPPARPPAGTPTTGPAGWPRRSAPRHEASSASSVSVALASVSPGWLKVKAAAVVTPLALAYVQRVERVLDGLLRPRRLAGARGAGRATACRRRGVAAPSPSTSCRGGAPSASGRPFSVDGEIATVAARDAVEHRTAPRRVVAEGRIEKVDATWPEPGDRVEQALRHIGRIRVPPGAARDGPGGRARGTDTPG